VSIPFTPLQENLQPTNGGEAVKKATVSVECSCCGEHFTILDRVIDGQELPCGCSFWSVDEEGEGLTVFEDHECLEAKP